jgi:predicted CXXCH cytochrome family protein
MTGGGSYLVCTGCHTPHGSDFEKLWPGDMQTFCTRCHPF